MNIKTLYQRKNAPAQNVIVENIAKQIVLLCYCRCLLKHWLFIGTKDWNKFNLKE